MKNVTMLIVILIPTFASCFASRRNVVVFTSNSASTRPRQVCRDRKSKSTITARRMFLSPDLLPIFAGSVAGALGVGVAFPFDTLKTKAQVLRQNGGYENAGMLSGPRNNNADTPDVVDAPYGFAIRNDTAFAADPAGALLTYAVPAPTSMVLEAGDTRNFNMLQLFALVLEREGVAGFFSGVGGMMMGQAVIKALAFWVNAHAIVWLHANDVTHGMPDNAILYIGACFAGFVTSFPTAPIERIKVMMQAQEYPGYYKSEMDCLLRTLNGDGVGGLLTRGLGTTLLRETPSYGVYFGLYAYMMATPLAHAMPYPAAPLLFGALSGVASWIPVYPFDVVKTIVQNSEGTGEEKSAWQVAQDVYNREGYRGFWDGLDAKVMRAAINHAVTFYTYDLIMSALK